MRRFMPLPKSILCSACRKTYPEGWRRCPYCGHDELRLRQDAIARRFMQKKLQEYEQRVGSDRRAAKPPRPESRGQEKRGQQQSPAPGGQPRSERPGRGRRRRRRGAHPPAQATGAPPPPPTRPPPHPPGQPPPEGGRPRKRRRFRRRRGGKGGDGGAGGGGGGTPT